VGRNIAQIDLDKGLRTAQSPALLAMGLGLVAVGATLAALVFANWSYILSVTKNSVAAAAGGAAAASLLALMDLALVYASREVSARGSPFGGRRPSGTQRRLLFPALDTSCLLDTGKQLLKIRVLHFRSSSMACFSCLSWLA
jgi:hypothetical protein